MKSAFLSDIHSNLSALENVCSYLDAQKIETVYCLGDIVGYGPRPDDCITLIRQRCSGVVAGNHDWALIDRIALKRFTADGEKSLRWSRKHVSRENSEFLESLPLSTTTGNFTLAHATPADPESWDYIVTRESALKAFAGFGTQFCCVGHTHVPAIIDHTAELRPFTTTGRFLINVGSVGQPRDGDPRTSFGVYDAEAGTFEIVRLEYDVASTVEAMRREGLPRGLSDRLLRGL